MNKAGAEVTKIKPEEVNQAEVEAQWKHCKSAEEAGLVVDALAEEAVSTEDASTVIVLKELGPDVDAPGRTPHHCLPLKFQNQGVC